MFLCFKSQTYSKHILIQSQNRQMRASKKNAKLSSKEVQSRKISKVAFNLAESKEGPNAIQLPHFLLTILDQIAKIDQFQVLQYDKLIYPFQQLIPQSNSQKGYFWLFIDPFQDKHIIAKQPYAKIDADPSNPFSLKCPLKVFHEQSQQPLIFCCQNVLATTLSQTILEEISKTQLITLNQVKLRCQANVYTQPTQVDSDIRRLLSWCQIYRANSIKGFKYISTVYQQIVLLLAKTDFFKTFIKAKRCDLKVLMLEQLQYKVSTAQWPFIPKTFREYEQIQEYVPTPNERKAIINDRIRSEKEPVQCSPNCICLVEDFEQGQYFCRFSLVNGWETTCPNRAKKIQCRHEKQSEAAKCKNSQIKKQNRKKCKGKIGVSQEEAQIQERLTWGMDLYTRNVIYKLLPAFDIQDARDRIDNQERKQHFIQKTLIKALNFLGPQGYSFRNACLYIKQHAKKPQVSIKTQPQQLQDQKIPKNLNGQTSTQRQQTNLDIVNNQLKIIFSQKDWEYADLLLKNYELVQDKSAFRLHTKGKGAICIDRKGITQGSFITQYLGEIYQLWRWFDRQDLVKQVLKKKKFKNYMPEFYNIALQKHPDEPLGCDILMVDPSKKGNFSSRFSHSCDPNCGTVTTISNGRYYVGMYAFKDIAYGEELTFDYCSMTESTYQHLNSICLCGMKRCRGFYLQLSNTKMFSNLMDTKNCFLTRNSVILNALGKTKQQHIKICVQKNIRHGLLQRCPQWLIRWISEVLKFINEEGQVYRQRLIYSWRKKYPWGDNISAEEKEQNIQKYSLTSCQQLQSIRLQNLITSVDKITYFLENNQEKKSLPPLLIQPPMKIYEILVEKKDSVLLQLQQSLFSFEVKDLVSNISTFLRQIKETQNIQRKLSIFRFCCLIISHKLLLLRGTSFNNLFLADILYFYAFTHTYFSPNQYNSFDAEEIIVSANQILGKPSLPNQKKERSCKKYVSSFVWGQMVTWFKQTVMCPEGLLSQDRRGTLSYPLINSIMNSYYPNEKQSRAAFMKMLLQKPTNSWHSSLGSDLSFKNPHKLYGTIMFESIHSRKRLEGLLPKETLLQSCIQRCNQNLGLKLQLFKTVEQVLGGLPKDHYIYSLAELGGDPIANIPIQNRQADIGQPRKIIKKNQWQS